MINGFKDSICNGILSGNSATVADMSQKTSLKYEDVLKIMTDIEERYRDPNRIDGIFVTAASVLPSNDEMYKCETSDNKKYLLMHVDAWNKLLEVENIVTVSFGQASIMGIPVIINDMETWKVWMAVCEKACGGYGFSKFVELDQTE